MAVNNFSSGQALSLINWAVPIDIPSASSDNKVFSRDHTIHGGRFSIRLEAVKWTGAGNILVKDAHGVELFSGATANQPVKIHTSLPSITVAAPLLVTVTSGSTGSVIFYGEVS